MSDLPTTPDAPLTDDLPCTHCGYNLRTKRPSERCPECNAGVQPSIEAARRGLHLPHRGSSIAGFALLAASYLLVLALMSLHYLPTTPRSILGIVANTAWIVSCPLFVAGILLLLHAFRKRPILRPGMNALLAVAALVNASVNLYANIDGLSLDYDWGWTLIPDNWANAYSVGVMLSALCCDLLLGLWLLAAAAFWRSFPLRILAAIVLVLNLVGDLPDAATAIANCWTTLPLGDTYEIALYSVQACATGCTLALLVAFTVRAACGRTQTASV